MKGKVVTAIASVAARVVSSVAVLGAAALFSASANAEYVAAESPSWQGMPLTSYIQPGSGPSSSINSSIVVKGSSLIVNELALPSAGTLTIKLSDIKWPDTLQSLTFMVTDLKNTWNAMDPTTGNLLINIDGPTQLFAAVFARSQSEGMYGLYNLRADFAPVPLPAGVWLLLSGLGAIGIRKRRS
jgi:hypothetical protein